MKGAPPADPAAPAQGGRTMTLIRWDPFKNAYILQDRINRLFDDAFPGTKLVDEDMHMGAWKPAVDIFDAGRCIVIHAELPGIKKEAVSVDVKGNVLTLKGRRSVNPEVRDDQYFRKERKYGPFHRAFSLPSEIDPDGITAKFKDGILEIEIPRLNDEASKQVSIKVQ